MTQPDPHELAEAIAVKLARYRHDFTHLSLGDRAVITILLNENEKLARRIEALERQVSRPTQMLQSPV